MARLILSALLLFSGLMVQAGDWRSRTTTGDRVTVDQNTNRATVTRDGVTSPLWDGTHRMQDGSVLIIRRGIAVPNKSVLESREVRPPETAEWEDVQIVGYSPCEKLVRHVCGRVQQCNDGQGCKLSHQLLAMEQEERNASNNRNLMTYTSGQCLHAFQDSEFFPACRLQAADEEAEAAPR